MAPILSRLVGNIGGGSIGGPRRRSGLSQFVQYYIFTSPGSLNTNLNNQFGFVFSPVASVNLLTIGNGSSGSPYNNTTGGNGGDSGNIIVLTNSTLSSVAPGGTIPITIGTISGGVSLGTTAGGAGGVPAVQNGYNNGLPGSNGNPGTFLNLPTYSPIFSTYSFSAGSGGTGGTGSAQGGGGGGGGGGAGGLVITKVLPDTPLNYAPTVGLTTASTGGNAGSTGGGPSNPSSPPRTGGTGGTGGTGYGSGGGGGGGQVENWGAYSPGGGGGSGASGIFIVKISEFK